MIRRIGQYRQTEVSQTDMVLVINENIDLTTGQLRNDGRRCTDIYGA